MAQIREKGGGVDIPRASSTQGFKQPEIMLSKYNFDTSTWLISRVVKELNPLQYSRGGVKLSTVTYMKMFQAAGAGMGDGRRR